MSFATFREGYSKYIYHNSPIPCGTHSGWGIDPRFKVWGCRGQIPEGGQGFRAYLHPKSIKNCSPKHLKTAKRVIILHTLGVQVRLRV